MKRNFPAILVLSALSFSPGARCASKEEPANPETLVAKARLQQVWDERTPPLRIKTELGVAGTDGTTAQGNYIFDWVSPTEWREEIKFANYERLRVRDAKGYWQKSTLDFQPMLVYRVVWNIACEGCSKTPFRSNSWKSEKPRESWSSTKLCGSELGKSHRPSSLL